MLGEVGWMWCRMFKSLQLYYTTRHGLFCLHCCCCRSALCFKTVNPGCLLFLTVLATSLGPSPQSSTQCQQTFPCCTVCLVWLALGAREVPHDGTSLGSSDWCLMSLGNSLGHIFPDNPYWLSTVCTSHPVRGAGGWMLQLETTCCPCEIRGRGLTRKPPCKKTVMTRRALSTAATWRTPTSLTSKCTPWDSREFFM